MNKLECLFGKIEDDVCMPPLHNEQIEVDYNNVHHIFRISNDGFEIAIGYSNKWCMIMNRNVLHKFIVWYLYQWCFKEWFGLKRYLYYKQSTLYGSV